MGPAAGGMHLLPRDQLALAHRVLLTLAIFAPALAHAKAALAEMPVEGGSVLVFLIEVAQIAQIAANSFRRSRGVLPTLPGHWLARNKGSCPQPSFAYVPYFLLLVFFDKQLHGGLIQDF